jgi:hypothetical protein
MMPDVMVSWPREWTVADFTAVSPVSASVYDTLIASPRVTCLGFRSSRFEDNGFAVMRSSSKEGSYLRLI